MATCKGCGAEIEWMFTENGHKMPVNKPMLTVITKDGKVIQGQESHFASCPKADDFRRRD
jgi:hypothetical protein